MVNLPQGRSGRNLGSGGGSSVGAVSFDAKKIKNAFFSKCSARRLQRISGDGGYWTGGRCDWGAGHNLEEDINKLVSTFNKVADMSGAIAGLKECSSSSEFSAHKNALLAKANQAIAEMNLGAIEGNVGYRSGLCIIWTDYTATFLTPYISAFTNDLNRQMQEINNLNYEELVELEKLQLEEQQVNKEIEEAYRQAEEAKKKGDDAKATELYQVIKNLKKKHDGIVNQMMANPWNKANQYDYTKGINNIIDALERGKGNNPPPNNRFPNPNAPNQPGGNSNGNNNPPPNQPPNNPWQPNSSNQNSGPLDQQTLILIVGVVLVVVFLMMNQKDSSSHHKDYDEFDYY